MDDYSQFGCFFNSIADRLVYSYDAKGTQQVPLGVFFPVSVDETSNIVKALAKRKHRFVVRGAGSGMVGGSVALDCESYIISLEKMDKIISFEKIEKKVVCQAGIINGDLDRHLKTFGFSYPPDPASKEFSSIGGNVATNSGGLNSRKWGTTADYILGLTVVLANGDVIKTGEMTNENCSNKLVEHLVVGSEGTLGVICEVALRVVEVSEPDTFFLVHCQNRNALFRFLNRLLLQQNILPDNIEYIEGRIISLVHKYMGLPSKLLHIFGRDVLIIRANSKSENFNVQNFKKFLMGEKMEFVHEDKNDDTKIWSIRKNMSQSMHFIGEHKINEDISIPIEKIEEFLDSLGKLPLSDNIYTFGHAGDGNLHINVMLKNGFDKQQAHECVKKIFEKVIGLGGSLSGEHGIGYAKKEFYHLEHAEKEIFLLKAVKIFFDSTALLNSGKIFDLAQTK